MLTETHLAFLRKIKENPFNDLPRLVYADWLDENPQSDLDVATAEFIRVSCPLEQNARRKSKLPRTLTSVMPSAAYDWIDKNWWRLLPTLFANKNRMDKLCRRDGAVIRTTVARSTYGQLDANGWSVGSADPNRRVRANFCFRRGFVSEFTMYSVVLAEVWPMFDADQPIADTRWGHTIYPHPANKSFARLL